MSTKRAPSPLDNFGGANPKRVDPSDETVVLTVRLPRRTVEVIDREAAAHDETRSAFLRSIVTAIFR